MPFEPIDMGRRAQRVKIVCTPRKTHAGYFCRLVIPYDVANGTGLRVGGYAMLHAGVGVDAGKLYVKTVAGDVTGRSRKLSPSSARYERSQIVITVPTSVIKTNGGLPLGSSKCEHQVVPDGLIVTLPK